MTLSVKTLWIMCNYAECRYAMSQLLIVMLNVIMRSLVMPSVVMLYAVVPQEGILAQYALHLEAGMSMAKFENVTSCKTFFWPNLPSHT
jgi:hypothetical protein